MSKILAGHPLLACMCHLQLQKSCHYIQNQSYILCYHLVQEHEEFGYEGLVLWQTEHYGIGHGLNDLICYVPLAGCWSLNCDYLSLLKWAEGVLFCCIAL